MEDFMLRGLMGGVGVALVTGPVGCFIVWRKMAYFGNSMAHTALLGVAIGFAFGIDLRLGILISCMSLTIILVFLQSRKTLSTDTLLGILAHMALAVGFIAVSVLDTLRVDLMGYLFGDILAVGALDLWWIYLGGAAAMGVLAWLWRGLLAVTVNEELASAEGVPTFAVKLVFMLLIAFIIAVAMKLIGILLILSMLIIPPAAARRFSKTPEQMAALAVLAGVVSVGAGLWASLEWDAPAGPCIVVAASALFLFSYAWEMIAGRG